jgi:tetratricopeptide (TPR) repeat protein
MQTLLNPYIAGAPIVEPSMFFGRQDVFQWIERNLSGKYVDHILVIHGQRRVGKTSVLKQIPNYLPETYIQVFFDLQGRTTTTLDRFLWWLGREIARVLRQSHGLAVPVPDQAAFTEDLEYLYAQFLPGLKPLLGEHKLLLTFDEFDTLEQPEIRETMGRPLIDYLRRLFEMETLNFIFSIGSSGRKLENMQASYTDFFKTALYRKISFLSKDDCQQLIARPVEGVLAYDPQAIERIYTLTGGHPYFAQLVCHELFSLCQKTGKRSLSEGDVDAILDDVIERGTVNLKFTWDEASNLEKWILACLAQAEGAVSMAELSRSLQAQRVRALNPDLNAALLHLREKDVLSDRNQFVVYLLHRWLQKNRPLERVREELVEVNPIANRYIEIGEEYHSIGQVKKSLESFQQALAVDPQNLKAQTSMAGIYLDQKDYPAAAQAFEKALAIDDEDVSARTGVCDAYLALGEAALEGQGTEQARGYYQRVLEVNWSHGEARQRLADIYRQQAETALVQGDDEAGLAALDEALHYTPDDEALQARRDHAQELMREKALAAVLEKSRAAASAGRWEQAIAPLKEALQATPGEPRLLAALEGVISAGRQAHLGALRQQAQGAADAGQWEVAAQTWRDYLALEPKDATQAQEALQHTETQAEMAQAYQEGQRALEAKDYGQAVSRLKKVVLQDETYKDSARLLALAIEGQRKRRRVFTLPKWAKPSLLGPALAGVMLLAGLVFVGTRFGPSWMAGLKRTAEVQLPTTATNSGSLETSAGTPQPAVIQPPNTATALGAQPAWVEGFAAPVLQEIQGRAPDFEDDFSTLRAEWISDIGQPIDNLVAEGVLRVDSGGGLSASPLNAPNFALQFDFLPPQSEYKFGFRYRIEGDGGNYGLYFHWGGNWNIFVVESAQKPGTNLAGETNSVELVPGKWARALLIVQGDEQALFLNGKPTAYLRDARVQGVTNYFGFDEGTKTLDNVKFWRLENLGKTAETPAPTEVSAWGEHPAWVDSFTNPVLEAIQGRSPDFEDDFSAPKPEWSLSGSSGELKIEDYIKAGVLEVGPETGSLDASTMSAANFVIEFDFLPPAAAFYKFGFRFRGEADGRDYSLYFSEKNWGLLLTYPGQQNWPTLAEDKDSPEIVPGQWTHVKLIVQGDQSAFFLNGKPVGYIQDRTLSGDRIGFNFAEGTKTLDNIKFWRLEEMQPPSTATAMGAPKPPSATPPPTQTASPAWVMDFAQPILDSIRDRKPSFEEDFTAPDALWHFGNGGELSAEETSKWRLLSDYVQGGEMRVDFDPNTFYFLYRDLGTNSNYAVQFDVMLEASNANTKFYVSPGKQTVTMTILALEQWWSIGDSRDSLIYGNGYSPEIGNNKLMRVLFIAKGYEFAVFLNDVPLTHFESDKKDKFQALKFDFKTGGGRFKVMMDNLKYWIL